MSPHLPSTTLPTLRESPMSVFKRIVLKSPALRMRSFQAQCREKIITLLNHLSYPEETLSDLQIGIDFLLLQEGEEELKKYIALLKLDRLIAIGKKVKEKYFFIIQKALREENTSPIPKVPKSGLVERTFDLVAEEIPWPKSCPEFRREYKVSGTFMRFSDLQSCACGMSEMRGTIRSLEDVLEIDPKMVQELYKAPYSGVKKFLNIYSHQGLLDLALFVSLVGHLEPAAVDSPFTVTKEGLEWFSRQLRRDGEAIVYHELFLRAAKTRIREVFGDLFHPIWLHLSSTLEDILSKINEAPREQKERLLTYLPLYLPVRAYPVLLQEKTEYQDLPEHEKEEARTVLREVTQSGREILDLGHTAFSAFSFEYAEIEQWKNFLLRERDLKVLVALFERLSLEPDTHELFSKMFLTLYSFDAANRDKRFFEDHLDKKHRLIMKGKKSLRSVRLYSLLSPEAKKTLARTIDQLDLFRKTSEESLQSFFPQTSSETIKAWHPMISGFEDLKGECEGCSPLKSLQQSSEERFILLLNHFQSDEAVITPPEWADILKHYALKVKNKKILGMIEEQVSFEILWDAFAYFLFYCGEQKKQFFDPPLSFFLDQNRGCLVFPSFWKSAEQLYRQFSPELQKRIYQCFKQEQKTLLHSHIVFAEEEIELLDVSDLMLALEPTVAAEQILRLFSALAREQEKSKQKLRDIISSNTPDRLSFQKPFHTFNVVLRKSTRLRSALQAVVQKKKNILCDQLNS